MNKFKKLNKNIYSTICPINFTNEQKLTFGIRNYKNINETIEFKNDNIYKCRKKGSYETFIEKNENNIFDIFNEPDLNDNKTKLLYLEKLNEFDYYKCEDIYIKKATDSIPYKEIIDKIVKIGIEHKLTKKLIYILKEKDVNIFQISNYLESNKNDKFKDKQFQEVSSYIIYELSNIKNLNQEEKIENNNDKKDCIICCNKNIPVIIPKEDLDNKYKHLFENIKEKFRGNKNEIELDSYKKEIEKKIENLNNKDIFNICSLTDETLKKLRFLEYGIGAKISMIL